MTTEGPTATAVRAGARWPLFLGLAATVFVLDQLTKAWLVSRLAPGQSESILGDWIRIVHGQNNGALFGLFRDQALIFGVLSLGVVVAIVWYQAHAGESVIVTLALGLLLGGAFGNLVDRLRLGYVVDFVDLGIGNVRWYTFNVADAAISTAIVLLIALAVVPGLDRRASGG